MPLLSKLHKEFKIGCDFSWKKVDRYPKAEKSFMCHITHTNRAKDCKNVFFQNTEVQIKYVYSDKIVKQYEKNPVTAIYPM